MVLRIGADSTTMDSGTVDLFSSRPRQVCQMARYVKVLGNTGENLAALPGTNKVPKTESGRELSRIRFHFMPRKLPS